MIDRYESTHASVQPLSEPLAFKFSKKKASNRFCKAATTERLSSWSAKDLPSRGIPSPDLIHLYRTWGEGGIGLIITGNIMVELDQLEAPGNLIIPRGCSFDGPRFSAFQELAAAGKAQGSLMIGQVNHPGRQAKSRLQPDPVSASALQLKENDMGEVFEKPHAASYEEIDWIVEGFAHAAEYLEKAGFDGIQLHAAHGYLLAQFLSPRTNQRVDEYGGPLSNRSRLIFSIATAIRARVSESFILSIKLNTVEFAPPAFSLSDCTLLATRLEQASFDFVELSGGTYESLAFHHVRESTRKREAFFLEFAEKLAPELKDTKVYLTGGFRTVGGMVDALHSIDGIGMVRALCQEPRLCNDILSGRVRGVTKLKVGEGDGVSSAAAGTQLSMVARGQEPVDLGTEAGVESFMRALGRWIEEGKTDEAMEASGWPDISCTV